MLLKYFSIIALAIMALPACNTSGNQPSAEKVKVDVYDESYYQDLGNNMLRLLALRSGLFVQYRLKKDGTLNPWKRGDDSLFLYTRPVGIPNRDGYWLLSQQFLSSLPAEPLVTWLEYIERINRDSFQSYSRGWASDEGQPSFMEVSETGFNVTEHGVSLDPPTEEEAPKRFFKRKAITHFLEETILKSPLNQERKEKYTFRKTTNDYQPRWVTVSAYYYAEDTTLLTVKTNKKLRLPAEATDRIRQQYLTPEGAGQ